MPTSVLADTAGAIRNIIADKIMRQTRYDKDRVVYAKQPFGGPEQVTEYLGRYTHEVAICNHRIKDISDGREFFGYKDYADSSKQEAMKLAAQ